MDSSNVEDIVSGVILTRSKSLENLSQQIWQKPELKFEEFFAHDLLTNYLENAGFNVVRKYILPTAFIASFSNTDEYCPTLAVLCEYDALPEIGHACGHNLIAEAGVAIGLAVKAVLEKYPSIKGKIVVLGTPGEEGGGGKIILANAGVFDNIDLSIMVHPCKNNSSSPGFNCSYPMSVVFKGKESHAALTPWEGLNALDAAVSCYVNIGLLRQQIKPDWRINMIIIDGGRTVNVIPQRSEIRFLLRTSLLSDLEILKGKIINCCNSAANATGCNVEIILNEKFFYKNVLQNSVISSRFDIQAKKLGFNFPPDTYLGVSTDFGNVSHIIPSLHPVFDIDTTSSPHSVEFGQAAGAQKAQPFVLKMAKVTALTLIDFFQDSNLIKSAKEVLENKNTEMDKLG